METFQTIVTWYAQHKDYFDFVREIVFAVGLIATFYGYTKLLKYLTQRKALVKRQEMENDAKLYDAIHQKLKERVDSYNATEENPRDIGVRLLYMENYPYKLANDGYDQMLYYYFMSEHHKASGYISGKGLYLMEHIWFYGNNIYYNQNNEKWFIDKKGLSFKKYSELNYKQLVRRIPFANIYGYDFNSDWAFKGEPVFYTKYKYDKWKLYADDLEAVNIDQKYHLASKLHLSKKKRTRRFRSYLKRLNSKVSYYFLNRKHKKETEAKKQGK